MSFIINPFIHAVTGGPPPVYDAVSTNGASAVNLSWSHTVASQSNRILLVWVYYWNASGRSISGITYNGVALSHLSLQANGGLAQRTLTLWYLLNPDVGTHTVAVTGTGASADKQGIAISVYDAVQSAPTASPQGGDGATPNVTVTGTTSDLFLDGVGIANTAAVFAVGANQTQRAMFTQGDQRTAASTAVGTASESMDWTITNVGSRNWAIIAVKVGGV